MIRKIGLYLYRIIIFLAFSFVFGLEINYIMDKSLKLLYFDIKSGFCDNKKYMYFFAGIILALWLVFSLWIKGSKKGVSLCWKIRIGKREIKSYCSAYKVNYVVLIVSIIVLVVGLLKAYSQINVINVSEWRRDKTVAHSFGSVDGITYTGSLEAFETNYALGHRTFEVDLAITSDDIIVLRHDWNQNIQKADFSEENVPTVEEFLDIPILERYTPLTVENLFVLMKEYPDIWIVLDSKVEDAEDIKKQYGNMIQIAERLEVQEVLDRLIIQLYNEEMYEVVNQIYPFKEYIFTLYRRWDGSLEEFTQLCRWSVAHDVDIITMWADLANDDVLKVAERYDIDVYVHTVNNCDDALGFLKRGVKGIYTDFIIPSELEEEKR